MPTTYAIPNGATQFAATLYTGNGTSLAVNNGANNPTGVTFQPDLVWVKSRSQVADHGFQDSVRGTPILYPNLTSAESAGGYWISSYNSNGFTMNSNTSGNNSGSTYVGWQWKAGGTAVSNTSGSITSQVSANTTAGFSIVSYTGNGTNGATVGHGLGAQPWLIIEKGRSTTYNWSVQGCGKLWSPATSTLFLNTTAALNAGGAIAAPTSTVFTPSIVAYANESGVANIAYCFAPVAGYSAFGSYTGNGSTDGPFVYLGFRPRFVLWKRTDSTSDWTIIDTSRDTYNYADKELFPNSSSAETVVGGGLSRLDILSNGFKVRGADSYQNASGGTYIYACFAENPFKYANAR